MEMRLLDRSEIAKIGTYEKSCVRLFTHTSKLDEMAQWLVGRKNQKVFLNNIYIWKYEKIN
jgi:hypothetical protein